MSKAIVEMQQTKRHETIRTICMHPPLPISTHCDSVSTSHSLSTKKKYNKALLFQKPVRDFYTFKQFEKLKLKIYL